MKSLIISLFLLLPLLGVSQQSWWGLSYEPSIPIPLFEEYYFTTGPPKVHRNYGRLNQAIGVEYGFSFGKNKNSISFNVSNWLHRYRYTFSTNWPLETISDLTIKVRYLTLGPTYSRYFGNLSLSIRPTLNYASRRKFRSVEEATYTPIQINPENKFKIGTRLSAGWLFPINESVVLQAEAFFQQQLRIKEPLWPFIANVGGCLTLRWYGEG